SERRRVLRSYGRAFLALCLSIARAGRDAGFFSREDDTSRRARRFYPENVSSCAFYPSRARRARRRRFAAARFAGLGEKLGSVRRARRDRCLVVPRTEQ